MKEKFRLYHNTRRVVKQWVSVSDSLLAVMTWFIIGFTFAQNAALPRVAAKIPWSTKLPSRTQRLWRWLSNERINSEAIAASIASCWLANFRNQTIYLVIDRTDISDTHWLLFVGLAYRGRTFPLVWQVMPGKGSTSFTQQSALLKVIVPMIDCSCTVVLLGDREFRSTALMGFCCRRGWHFLLRLKCDTWITAQRRSFQLRDIPLEPGEKRYYTNVYITRNRRGPYHLAVYREKGSSDPWYIATDEHASAQTLRLFEKRFYVEAMFSDFKSRGFDIEKTRIRNPERIDRILLIVVIGYLFITQHGLRCIRCGLRPFFEKHRRYYSLFRLGELYFSHRFDGGKDIWFSLPRLE